MSTRWYPLYQRGNPQLRVFLPNFWMKVVNKQYKSPDNIVEFHCSMEMTKYDVKNYLEKIYNLNVVDVRTRIKLGKFKKSAEAGYIIKDDDIKVAYAVLPKTEKFVIPDIFKKEEASKENKVEKKTFDEMKDGFKQYLDTNNKPGVPGWFNF